MADDMRNLGQEIITSFDDRVAWVKALKHETGEMLKGIRARQQERSREVAGMLVGFRREREAAASQWRNIAATMARKRAGGR